jgi:hypothetical protein
MNKRGQGLSTNAIILIILGVIILVILILGFSLGWDKIAPWVKKETNVDDVGNACNIACSTNSVYDFCTKTVKLIDGNEEFSDTCNRFASAEVYEKYHPYVDACENFDCP